mgnify:CR=1 FL=1
MRTWAEVSLDRLAHNYHALRGLTPYGTKFMGLVKADAYGHGAVPIAQKLEELGADYLGVACLAEAVELRQAGVQTPILILGGTPAAYAAELVRYHITQACYDLDYAKALSAQVQETGGTLTVHIQCDTGMSRLGFLCHEDTMEQAAQEIAQAVELPGLHAEGIFTHFSDADGSEEYTMLQFDRFLDILQRVQTLGHTFAIRHCANSAATLLYPATYLDMVRPGIALYGHFPDGNMDPALCDLQPVMEVKSRVVTVRTVPAGTPVSYGRTNVLQRQTRRGAHWVWGWLLPWLLQPAFCAVSRGTGPCHRTGVHGHVYGGRHRSARGHRRQRRGDLRSHGKRGAACGGRGHCDEHHFLRAALRAHPPHSSDLPVIDKVPETGSPA